MREIDLQRMVNDVAAEEGGLALRLELDDEMSRRVAGRGLERQMLLKRLRAVDHVCEPGLDDRQHAVAQRATDRGAFLWIAIDCEEVIVVGLAPDVFRI